MLTARGEPVGRGDLTRQVRVIDIGLVGLRREDRALQRDQRGIGGLQTAVDLLVEVHVLLVVVEPEAGQQAQAIGDRPFELAEQRRADVLILQVLVKAVPVEQAGCRGAARSAPAESAPPPRPVPA